MTKEDRTTFTVPAGYEAVRDHEGRATGEVRRIEGRDPATIEAAAAIADRWASDAADFPDDLSCVRMRNTCRNLATAIRGLAAPSVLTDEGKTP